jgi:protein-S-isoprenylcysteine O-methyltransferase
MSLSPLLGSIYFASETLLTITRRSRSKTGTKQDKSTLGMIWVVIGLSIGAGILVSRSALLRDYGLWMFELPRGKAVGVAAVVLFAAGLILRWWAIITLGRFFTVAVTIERDHELVERGPFQWVRHPSYTGALLTFLGWALTLRNWAAIAVVLVPIFVAFVRRMNVEEDALSKALGQKYRDYMGRTKRLIPLVY